MKPTALTLVALLLVGCSKAPTQPVLVASQKQEPFYVKKDFLGESQAQWHENHPDVEVCSTKGMGWPTTTDLYCVSTAGGAYATDSFVKEEAEFYDNKLYWLCLTFKGGWTSGAQADEAIEEKYGKPVSVYNNSGSRWTIQDIEIDSLFFVHYNPGTALLRGKPYTSIVFWYLPVRSEHDAEGVRLRKNKLASDM